MKTRDWKMIKNQCWRVGLKRQFKTLMWKRDAKWRKKLMGENKKKCRTGCRAAAAAAAAATLMPALGYILGQNDGPTEVELIGAVLSPKIDVRSRILGHSTTTSHTSPSVWSLLPYFDHLTPPKNWTKNRNTRALDHTTTLSCLALKRRILHHARAQTNPRIADELEGKPFPSYNRAPLRTTTWSLCYDASKFTLLLIVMFLTFSDKIRGFWEVEK